MIKIIIDVNKNARVEGKLPKAKQAVQKKVVVAYELETGCEIHSEGKVETGHKGDFLVRLGRSWVVYPKKQFEKMYVVGEFIDKPPAVHGENDTGIRKATKEEKKGAPKPGTKVEAPPEETDPADEEGMEDIGGDDGEPIEPDADEAPAKEDKKKKKGILGRGKK